MDHNIHPQGYRILVKADEVQDTYGEAKIVVVEDKKMSRAAVNRGTVIEVGPLAFTGFKQENVKPWCKVGDRIVYAQYSGSIIQDPVTEEDFVIMNDEDVIATISKEQ